MHTAPGMYVDALDEFVECDGDRVLYKSERVVRNQLMRM